MKRVLVLLIATVAGLSAATGVAPAAVTEGQMTRHDVTFEILEAVRKEAEAKRPEEEKRKEKLQILEWLKRGVTK